MKIKQPRFDIIEETALKFAATYYEAARSSGMKSEYKTERLYALHNFDKWIPKAVEVLTDMLASPNTAENVKEKIYLALLERTNDPELQSIQPIDTLPNIDIKKLLDNTPLPPVVVETKKPLKQRLNETISVIK